MFCFSYRIIRLSSTQLVLKRSQTDRKPEAISLVNNVQANLPNKSIATQRKEKQRSLTYIHIYMRLIFFSLWNVKKCIVMKTKAVTTDCYWNSPFLVGISQPRQRQQWNSRPRRDRGYANSRWGLYDWIPQVMRLWSLSGNQQSRMEHMFPANCARSVYRLPLVKAREFDYKCTRTRTKFTKKSQLTA